MTEETGQGQTIAAGDDAILKETVTRIVNTTPVTDIHSHLYAPVFGDLLLWGVDELLIYHYLIAEALRTDTSLPFDDFWAMSKEEQADFIWQTLFLDHTPYSESRRGVLTSLQRLGLDVSSRNLTSFRKYFNGCNIEDHIDTVFQTANLQAVVMTNDPFDDVERPVWEAGKAVDPRFKAALRIDPLLNDWPHAMSRLKEWGYDVGPDVAAAGTAAEIRRFLSDWVKRIDALYMAVSLPPDFDYPDKSDRSAVIEHCILPVAKEHGIPFAMMIGVKRGVNPALKLAGDGVGAASLAPVERLCAENPDNKFMVTMLARENQHALCVAARKFRNLCLFGCWWFLNNPTLIEEMTRMRFELLGSSVIPQHSDARVLEQVVYKWDHSRAIITKVLIDKYRDLLATGWTLQSDEIARDAAALLGGNFWDFLGRDRP